MNDGGPAFPMPGVYDGSRDQVNPVGAYYDAGGMSLRAYVATKAMAALITGDSAQYICDNDPRYKGDNFKEVVAKNACEFADALIAELAKP